MRQTNEAMLKFQQIFSRLITGRAGALATPPTEAEDMTQRARQVEQQLCEAVQLTPHETREAAHEVSRHASSAVAQVLNEETAEPGARER
jgi:1,6-anhydro-N-acetylmuramate kinase